MKAPSKPRRMRSVRNTSIVIICLLVVQYLLGMISNLFVDFPTPLASVNPLDNLFTSGPYPVLIHLLNGLALGILSIIAIIVSVITRSRRLIILSSCGLGATLFAGEAGIEFVLGWYTVDVFSFLMSIGFILSFAAYFLLLWYSSQRASFPKWGLERGSDA